jgi:hypothetical protein
MAYSGRQRMFDIPSVPVCQSDPIITQVAPGVKTLSKTRSTKEQLDIRMRGVEFSDVKTHAAMQGELRQQLNKYLNPNIMTQAAPESNVRLCCMRA